MRSRDRQPSPATRPRASSAIAPVILLAIAWAVFAVPPSARAQATPPQAKAAGVFDEETKKDEAKPADPTKAAPATDRDSIGFTQQNVAAQMTELEERMFRLSEALRSLEPENASRLRLALKFSREELILQQMKETQKLMKEAQLSKAETEVRELLAKLEHLRNLLLAEDLDFQMKLARLRQMRESLGQLERIIKEEKRELTWSRQAEEQQAELARLEATATRPGSTRPRPESRGQRHPRGRTPSPAAQRLKRDAGEHPHTRDGGPEEDGRPWRRPVIRRRSSQPISSRPIPTWVTPRPTWARAIRGSAVAAEEKGLELLQQGARSPGRPDRQAGTGDRGCRVPSLRAATRPATAPRPIRWGSPRPGWETAAWPFRKT